MVDRSKIVQVVGKLVRLTSEGRIAWETERGSIGGWSGATAAQHWRSFTTVVEGVRLRLVEVRRQTRSLAELLAFGGSVQTEAKGQTPSIAELLASGRAIHEAGGYRIEFMNDDGTVEASFDDVAGLRDLVTAIDRHGTDIESRMDRIINY